MSVPAADGPDAVIADADEWAERHLELLGLVATEFESTKVWPDLDSLQRALTRRGVDIDVWLEASRIPRFLGGREPNSRLALTAAGLARTESGRRTAQDVVKVVPIAVDRYLGDGEAVVSDGDLIELGFTGARLEKVTTVLLEELGLWAGGTGPGLNAEETKWRRAVNSDIRHFKNVRTIADYERVQAVKYVTSTWQSPAVLLAPTGALPSETGAQPSVMRSSQGGVTATRSARKATYPTALPTGQPRAEMLIDLAGETQDAIHTLLGVSGIHERFARTSSVVSPFPWDWDQLAPEHARLLTVASSVVESWDREARRVIELAHADVHKFDGHSVLLARIIDRDSARGSGPPSASIGQVWRLAEEAILQQLQVLRGAVASSAAPDEALIVPDTMALIRWYELDKWPSGNPLCLVVLPTVLQELDRHKSDPRNPDLRDKADSLVRQYKSLRSRGNITSGVTITGKLRLRGMAITPSFTGAPEWMITGHADDQVLWSALNLAAAHPFSSVLLLTADANLQNKADLVRMPYIDLDEPTVVVPPVPARRHHIYKATTPLLLRHRREAGDVLLASVSEAEPFTATGALQVVW